MLLRKHFNTFLESIVVWVLIHSTVVFSVCHKLEAKKITTYKEVHHSTQSVFPYPQNDLLVVEVSIKYFL